MPSAVGYQPTLATEMGFLQERITSTNKGSVTSVQAVYVPADDPTDPAPGGRPSRTLTLMSILRGTSLRRVCIRRVDPLASTSKNLDPRLVGREHYDVARKVQQTLQRYRELQDIIAILGIDELSDDGQAVGCPRPKDRALPQPAELRPPSQFTGNPGRYVSIEETVRSFKEIVNGNMDEYPEQAFLYCGGLDDVIEKAKKLQVGV